MQTLKIITTMGLLSLSACFSTPKPLTEVIKRELSRKEIRKNVGAATYKLHSNNGHGTGFLVTYQDDFLDDDHKIIVTNAHVCKGVAPGGYIKAKRNDDDVSEVLRVVEISETHDLCAVDAGAFKFNYSLDLGKKASDGDYAAVIGFPLDNRLVMVEGEVVGDETISMLDDSASKEACSGDWIHNNPLQRLFGGPEYVCLREYDAVTVTANVYPGNSGSALIDKYGEVIGVVFATNLTTFFGRAVPLEDLKSFLGGL